MSALNGHNYKKLIASYLIETYGARGVELYDEVNVGTSIIGKQRRVDLFALHRASNRALAIECKYQDSSGTADEKIPYTLQDLGALRMPAVVAYAGSGFSEGVLHLLQSSELAAYCLPDSELEPGQKRRGIARGTWQLDHVVAMTFQFWDVLLQGKAPL